MPRPWVHPSQLDGSEFPRTLEKRRRKVKRGEWTLTVWVNYGIRYTETHKEETSVTCSIRGREKRNWVIMTVHGSVMSTLKHDLHRHNDYKRGIKRTKEWWHFRDRYGISVTVRQPIWFGKDSRLFSVTLVTTVTYKTPPFIDTVAFCEVFRCLFTIPYTFFDLLPWILPLSWNFI